MILPSYGFIMKVLKGLQASDNDITAASAV